ncbi:Squalene synthase isoform A [Chlorella sorokiniana]|uniref:squalene synthase n=1 Tax=Chlorella sorokiniana TaxID=3076 RepID=A0A2P6U3B5_CHLSO|nr:Squalene synthase isoform A [Chlorella sorokiniana]|eukprot:PRW60803.1 Squalene synthase isoform A [Chlorella sorokiniana]
MGKLGELLSHPDELVPMVSMALAARRAKQLPKQPGLAFCYDMLNRVSRSFAVVIQQLPDGLRDAVCVFYLVLRALDTVEDDMSLDAEVKIPLLRCFHEKCYDRSWKMSCGSGEYVRLMEHYPLVTDVFLSLDKHYQKVIADICRRMGAGMADFAGEDEASEVISVKDYDLYCHYVAGLVGVGLSQLFASSGYEDRDFSKHEGLANDMGLFLQKTNIIRDYLEDITEEPRPRMWWPKDIWGQYAGSLEDFRQPEHAAAAVACLNDMITNALGHVEACLQYMSLLCQPNIFKFCAIPQIMAIATLSLCYNNHNVFTGVVKMRRGEVAKVMYHLESYEDVLQLFRNYAEVIASKAQRQAGGDANQQRTVQLCSKIVASCDRRLQAVADEKAAAEAAKRAAPVPLAGRLLLLVLALLYVLFAYRIEQVRAWMGVQQRAEAAGLDGFNLAAACAFLCYALFVGLTGKKVLPSGTMEGAITLRNGKGVEVHILRRGATIQRLLVPDRAGKLEDVVLGFDDEAPYKDGTSPYMGAIVGRVANRIANASFELDGQRYKLAANNGPNCLHGGKIGYDKVEWQAAPEASNRGQAVRLTYTSPDGEEGFPGTVQLSVVYTLTEASELWVEMQAAADAATPINLAQHSYFNLAGHASGTVLGHQLTLHGGDHYTPVDDVAIPTGDIAPVRGTPFDFTSPHTVGERIDDVPGPAPGGYDHNIVLFSLGPNAKDKVHGGMASDTPQLAATLVDPGSGRGMNVLTTAPGVQFYSGNFLDGSLRSKGGAAYVKHAGLCLETQGFPNAINTPNFPSVVLRPGEEYRHTVVYQFFTEQS